jgi:ATP-dependent helicase/nuclease subunit A
MSNPNTNQDAPERKRALDPQQSFIVQAPAGSGKTELLTQRFLVLLEQVSQPEEILAITFTKKAAAEMRARIIKTLKKAALEPEPSAIHEKTTWQLAQRALKQDKALSWHLLDNPNRLRIQTIDSFCASLIKYLPILSHFGAPPDITDSPEPLYREAVQEFLTHLEEEVEWSDAIAQLLMHMDNNLNRVQELLISMLGKRDQWLPYIMTDASDDVALRERLEASLAAVVTDTLTNLHTRFPKHLAEEIMFLMRYAAGNLRLNKNEKNTISACLDLLTLPENSPDFKMAWLGIGELLLTKDHSWRKTSDKNIGFPAPSNAGNAQEKILFKEMKARHLELIGNLMQHEDLLAAFITLFKSPNEAYAENQWQTLHALHKVLKIVVAMLTVVFRQQGKIDYIENSQAASYALGNEEKPTDLALALDYQIKHILIDEFQDTSNSQYRLIEKLTAGWQVQDGRTLFVVGDPMQSIYRFREADVGLFIRARSHGIGHVRLEPLTLSVNFRSTPNVVNWVNQHFAQVLPSFDDIATGAVAYSPSLANQQNEAEGSLVKLHPHPNNDKHSQANALVELIQNLRREKPHETIAILVRARTHLAQIIPALKNAALDYRAIKIDPLDSRPAIQDLIALTRALIHPADRIAWFAILRAPWCGLSLGDLLLLAGNQADLTLLEALQQTTGLSEDGQARLARVLPILQTKMAARYRFTLHQWIESTWLSLGGAACLEQDSDLEDVSAYFNLLDQLDEGGTLINLASLTTAVNKLFASPNNQTDNTLQIMTIHNAKGLEFDTVILPHLEKQAPHDAKQLLLWLEKSREEADSALILAPVHATGAETDSIYEYIKYQNTTKTNHEIGRLLYVAATRAKKQLHLFFTAEINKSEEVTGKSNSLLKKVLASIQNEYNVPVPLVAATEKQQKIQPPIKRLVTHWQNPVHEIPVEVMTNHQSMPGFELTQQHPKRIGTLVHKILELIANKGSSWWEDKPLNSRMESIKSRLVQASVLTQDIPDACHSVNQAISNALSDPRGQWILAAHSESQTEVALTAVINGSINQLVIDRTFVDENGTRWIIDYKTSHPVNTSLENFLQMEYEEYADKMHLYYKALQTNNKNPIKLGLYFPMIPAWREWEIASFPLKNSDFGLQTGDIVNRFIIEQTSGK